MNATVKSSQTNQEVNEIIWVRDDGGLNQGTSNKYNKKYLGSGYILKVEPTEGLNET